MCRTDQACAWDRKCFPKQFKSCSSHMDEPSCNQASGCSFNTDEHICQELCEQHPTFEACQSDTNCMAQPFCSARPTVECDSSCRIDCVQPECVAAIDCYNANPGNLSNCLEFITNDADKTAFESYLQCRNFCQTQGSWSTCTVFFLTWRQTSAFTLVTWDVMSLMSAR